MRPPHSTPSTAAAAAPASTALASGGAVLRALAARLSQGPDADARVLIFAAVPAEAHAIAAGILRAPNPTLPSSAHAPTHPPAPLSPIWHPPENAPWAVVEIATGIDLCVTGVSKSNAAAAAARTLDPARHALVLCAGIAGALPDSGLSIADTVLASAVPFADEGAQEPGRFVPCHAMGFPLGAFPDDSPPADPRAVESISAALRALSPVPRVGPIACVSTCSATDGLALAVRERTRALAEAMEGAAIAAVCARLRVPFAEVRTISNFTGDRGAQGWDIRAALGRLSDVFGLL